ncbi:hypothetical protein D5282_18895 [bacterium 1xD8-48]|jgi:hypothetical protein|nr:hypothetical protein [bacterium 1xD8-48]
MINVKNILTNIKIESKLWIKGRIKEEREKKMSESNTKIEKIRKSSKAAYVVTNISKVFLIVCSILTILAGMLVIGLGGILNASLGRAIEDGAMQESGLASLESIFERDLGRRLMEEGNYALAIGIYVIIFGITMLLLALVLHFVSRIFKDFMESYSPFRPGILKNMKITLALIVFYTAQSGLGMALVVAMASWCVMNIFEYGCELQRQSDETL